MRIPLMTGGLPAPSLDLNFMAGTLPTQVTFTRASTATYYNSAGTLTTASSGAARFDYNPSTLAFNGFLAEEARTNLALQSNQFDTTWTVGASTVTAAAGTSPDATSNAWKFAEDNTNARHTCAQIITKAASALTYSYTVFAKAAERSWMTIWADNNAGLGSSQYVNVSTGALGSAVAVGAGFTSPSASVQTLGNGWYRISFIFTTDATTSIRLLLLTASGDGTNLYTGTTGNGILVYGAQLEQAPFPLSYIATTVAAVTRSQDVATVSLAATGIAADTSRSGVTLLVKFVTAPGQSTGNQPLVQLDDNSGSNVITINRATGGGIINCATVVATVTQENAGTGAVANSTAGTIWSAHATNNFACQQVGGTKATDTSGTMPTAITTARIGKNSGALGWDGWFRRVQFYATRLTDVQAAAIAAAL